MNARSDDRAGPARGPGGAHPDGPRLSRDQVIDAAVDLVGEHGLDALRMKSVAAALDVTPMALYWYVGSKAELVELVVDRVLDPVADLEISGGFEESARTIATTLYDRLRSYPGVANELMATQRYPVSLSRLIDLGMEIGVAEGFPPPEAAFRVNLLAFFTIVRGAVAAASDLGARTGTGSGRDRAVDQMAGVLDQLPSGPLFAEYLTYWLGTDEDELFHRGLDVLIAGMLTMRDTGAGNPGN